MSKDKAPVITQRRIVLYSNTEKLIIKRRNIRTELMRLTPEIMDKIGMDKADRPGEVSYLLTVTSLEDFKTRKIVHRGMIFRRSTLDALFFGLHELDYNLYKREH
ncbi:MAG TPA: hypothetical protein VHO03_16675 [Ignavibacteriales bacterium]|nr:hypothetical protein [Ignavibacteriales bacterium]